VRWRGLVALLVVTVKLGAIASIQVHSGLYIFGLEAILLMAVTGKVSKLVQQSTE
jgi:paraquat-inducible protein A